MEAMVYGNIHAWTRINVQVFKRRVRYTFNFYCPGNPTHKLFAMLNN